MIPMNAFLDAIQYIVDLGANVMLPIIIFTLGLILRRGVGKSLQAGLTIGAGFVGISLVINLLNDELGPAAGAMAENFGGSLEIVDLGWPGTSPMAWASTMGIISIPIAIAVNIAMLLTRTTRVLNVDIWNIWHMAFTGIIVQLATGNFWLGVLGVVVHAALAYKFGDMYGAVTDDYFGLEGVAIPHGTSAVMGVFAAPIDDLIKRIPGLRKVTINTETLEERVGFFGQPIVIGTLLGLVVGLLAGYPIGDSLQLAVEMGAVMLLMPMVVKLIMQGLMPIADAARDMLQKRFKNADYKIGLDPALLLGQPQVISASLIFVPLSIVIAILMPGNRVLPFGDLATIGFFVAIAVGIHKGNIFRTLFSGTLIMSVTIWTANRMVPLTTELARVTDKLGDASQVASLDQGGNPITYLLARGLSGQVGVGPAVIAALYVFCWVYTFVKYRRGTLYRADEPEPETEVAR